MKFIFIMSMFFLYSNITQGVPRIENNFHLDGDFNSYNDLTSFFDDTRERYWNQLTPDEAGLELATADILTSYAYTIIYLPLFYYYKLYSFNQNSSLYRTLTDQCHESYGPEYLPFGMNYLNNTPAYYPIGYYNVLGYCYSDCRAINISMRYLVHTRVRYKPSYKSAYHQFQILINSLSILENVNNTSLVQSILNSEFNLEFLTNSSLWSELINKVSGLQETVNSNLEIIADAQDAIDNGFNIAYYTQLIQDKTKENNKLTNQIYVYEQFTSFSNSEMFQNSIFYLRAINNQSKLKRKWKFCQGYPVE